MMIYKINFTKPSLILHNYKIYHIRHPNETAHERTDIIAKNNIRHYEGINFQEEHSEATNVIVEDRSGPNNIITVYWSPKYAIKSTQFKTYFHECGNNFIYGGDNNTKYYAVI